MPVRFLAVMLSVLLFCGVVSCKDDLRARFADRLPPGTSPIAATWIQGDHFLPFLALKNGSGKHLPISAKHMDWAQNIEAKHLKPSSRLPAVIFLHGCRGFGTGNGFVPYFLDEGFAVFAPNSFARPGRTPFCNGGSSIPMEERIDFRREELEFTLARLRDVPWIDTSRLILAGFSEGGHTVSSWSGREFMAQVLFGVDCSYSNLSPNAPLDIPVLNIVGSDDEYGYGGGCHISDNRAASSKSVVVKGADHALTGSTRPREEVTKFINLCCNNR